MKRFPEAIIFDLGGVVIDIDFNRCFEHWASSSDKSADEIRHKFKFDSDYAAHEISGISGEEYHRRVSETIGIHLSFAEFETGWNSIYKDPIEDTLSLLKSLQGKRRLYAFTNSNLLHRKVWTNKFKSELSIFDHVFCSSQIKLRKPEPKAFEKILLETGHSKDDVLFIDDLTINVQGAEQYGIKSYLFADPRESVAGIRSLLKQVSV